MPSRRKFVVLGDRGIHEKVGSEFWRHIVSVVSDEFKKGNFTEGLVLGIREVGERLADHFPHLGAKDIDELSNEVDDGNL